MNNDEGNSNSAPHSTPRSQNSVTEDSEATSFTASASTMPGSGSEEYAQLQEILSDFVMTGGRGAGYISGSFVDQNEAAAEVDSSLGRLFAHYKVLESRVTKLEAHVFGNLRGHSRLKRDYGKSSVLSSDAGGPPSSSSVSSSPRTGVNGRTFGISSISNGTFPAPTSNNTSSVSSSFAATINPLVFDRSSMLNDLKDLRRSDLDIFCLPVLQNNPKPEKEDLLVIARQLEHYYPQFRPKELLSKIREWFRKRREYMSQRIFHVCEETFPAISMTSDDRLRDCIAQVNQDDSLVLKKIVHDSQLEIIDEHVAREYVREKVVSHLTNAYKEFVKVKTIPL